jgi:hypothetical protein
VVLKEVLTPVRISVLSPEGKIWHEQIFIRFIGYERWKESVKKKPEKEPEKESHKEEEAEEEESQKGKNWQAQVGVSYSLLNTSETDQKDLSQGFLTSSFGFQYQLNPSSNLAVRGYYNTFQTQSSLLGESLSFFGLNVRVGYKLPFLAPPWSVQLLAGAFYANTFSGTVGRGFKNLISPHVFPMVNYQVKQTGSLYFYAKFAPLADAYRILSFNNREIGLGMGWIFFLNGGRSVGIGVDYSSLLMEFQKIYFDSTSFSLGLSYGF